MESSLLPFLLLTTFLLHTEAEPLAKWDTTSKYVEAVGMFAGVTDVLVGTDLPFTKLQKLTNVLSVLPGPVGAVFGQANSLVKLFGPKVPNELKLLGKEMNNHFDQVDKELANIKSKIDRIAKRNKINLQINKLDTMEEQYLNPLYRKYKAISRWNGNEHAMDDFKLQCERKSPYEIVPQLSDAFAHRVQAGSASLFDDMIKAEYPKPLIEAIRNRLEFDYTRAILMIPLCAPVRGWDKDWIKKRVTWAGKVMGTGMETINNKIYNSFYRDIYELQFCFLRVAPIKSPYWKHKESSYNDKYFCKDGFFSMPECEFKFTIEGMYKLPGSMNWKELPSKQEKTIKPVPTDGSNALRRRLCVTESDITYDKNPDLYKAILKGTMVEYQVTVTELDETTSADRVLTPEKKNHGYPTKGKVQIGIDSRSKLSSKVRPTTVNYGPSEVTWVCEHPDECGKIEFTWQFKQKVAVADKA